MSYHADPLYRPGEKEALDRRIALEKKWIEDRPELVHIVEMLNTVEDENYKSQKALIRRAIKKEIRKSPDIWPQKNALDICWMLLNQASVLQYIDREKALKDDSDDD